ncbi:MAG TPA: hypothetical protein VFL95_04290 [Gemmatimonadales bacterium]|nr:hypothetical protein [Gemmatimonadales bacterium]
MNFRSKLSLGAILAGAVAAGAWAAPLQAQVDTTQRDTSGYRAAQNDTSNAGISAIGQPVMVILRSSSGTVIDTLQGHQSAPGVVTVETTGRNPMMFPGKKRHRNDTTRMERQGVEQMNADSSQMERDSSRTGQQGISSDTSSVNSSMPPLNKPADSTQSSPSDSTSP